MIIIFVELIDQLIDFSINRASLNSADGIFIFFSWIIQPILTLKTELRINQCSGRVECVCVSG